MFGSARAAVFFALFIAACGPTAVHNNQGDDDNTGDASVPACTPGTTQACYTGAPGTMGVGPCVGGMQTCDSGGNWGACDGEVTPKGETCGNGTDENCNGMVDEDTDADGDGFSTCHGDCCDSTADGCSDPQLVNPGAFEAPGNMVDDDCDGTVDNTVAAACDSGLASNSANALDYAKAIELCQTATMTDTKWGVINARFVLPNGSGTPNADQRSIRPAFGATTVRAGSSFAVLSTGNAAAPGQTNPPYQAFQGGRSVGSSSALPADWLAANGNNVPNAPGCPGATGTTGNDPIMLELTIRTPTNAKSFKLSTNFMSSEYPEWTCSAYNDFFVVLLDSTWNGQPANPADKNLAIYKAPNNSTYPVGVNLAAGNTGLFQQCVNGNTGCALGATAGTINTCVGTNELVGTGMDTANPGGLFGYCGANNLMGGGTGWLVTAGNVKGGEIITLRIAIWDTSDGALDSLAIIDNFEWSVDASQPGTVIF
ncbi:MAG TPA: choice-of-anchor L domain-containing protein [Kofleriaceae bacterium]|nr:choice-of-anchor L domain-containing protein [Kofleriaceae bacterium]